MLIVPSAESSQLGDAGNIALKAVFNILELWKCSNEEMQVLLGLKKATFFKYKKMPMSAAISHDLLERLSYLLNIHASLRILFSTPDSVYGWVKKTNLAPFYNGRSALDVMLQGRVIDLWNVCSRLNAERAGWS